MSDMKREFAQRQDSYTAPPTEPIQQVVHISDEAGKITFIAIDPFNCHHFHIDAGRQTFSPFTTYIGNNETQLLLKQFLEMKHRNDGSREDQQLIE